MKNRIIKKVVNKVTNLLIILLLLTFILPYYANADTEEEEKKQAAVPAAAAKVLEGITTVTAAANISSSTSGTTSIDYPESGYGYESLTKVNGRKYKNYKQFGEPFGNVEYWGETLWTRGCAPTTIAIIASGLGIDKTPKDVAGMMSLTNGEEIEKALNNLGISYKSGSVSDGVDTRVNNIKENLEKGDPVMVGVNAGPDGRWTSSGHFLALLGISGDTLIISDAGKPGGTVEYKHEEGLRGFVKDYMSGTYYFLITQEVVNSSSGSTTSTSSAGGSGVIQETNSSETGYTGIFQSGTTGRQFKEYKQNIDGWDSKYKINDLPQSDGWTSECGTVSVIIVGSGYSDKATFEDITAKMRANAGSSALQAWTNEYTGQSTNFPAYGDLMSKTDFINGLSNGCVAVVHSSSMSDRGHYVAILDIKPDKSQVYVSNPWEGDSKNGWIDVDTVYGWLDAITLVTNDGGSVNYGTGITSLDNFLFIGDSRTALIEGKLEALGSGITAKGVSASTPGHWKEVTKTGGPSTVLSTSVTLPGKSSVKGVSVALGVNATGQVSEMKEVLNNLLERYPDTPIFVNSVFYVGSGYRYGTLDADKMNSNIDEFNNSIKEFCNSNSNLIYIDITTGLYDSGALKSSYSDDNLHLNNSGNNILIENIKEAILSSGAGGTTGSYSMPNLTSNISQYITENGRGGYKIDIDLDEKVDEMLEILKEQSNRDVDNFLKTSNKKEYLKAMLKAELVTQFPDLRSVEELEASDNDEEQIENIEENLPEVIASLEIIHNATENLIEQKFFETEEELNNAIQNKLNGVQYETEQDGENTIYTYVKDGKNYRLEKIGKESYNLYNTDDGEVTDQEQYVFDSLKNENVQDKIYNIIMSGRITKEAIHNYFYTTLFTVSDARGYDINEMEDLYFNYITRIREGLAESDDTLLEWLNELFSAEEEVPEDELQGVIRIKRKTINTETGEESSRYLSYIPYDEFTQKCNNADNSVLNHFTINSSGAIIAAKWKQHIHQPIGVIGGNGENSDYSNAMEYTATYEITQSSPLSYLSQIYQHTMPFELLWTLLVYGGDNNFIYDLTNLVFNSKITITALETITERTVNSSETVYVSTREVNNAETSDESISSEETDGYSYTVQYQDYYKESNVQLKVSHIDSWIATYTNNDEVVDIEESDNSDNPETSELEGTDWEQQGEIQQADGNQASAMVNSNSELLEQYKALIKEKVKENVNNYTNSSVNQNTLNNAKEIIKNNNDLLNAYVDNIRTNDMFPFLSQFQEAVQNDPLINGELILNAETISKVEQATSDTNTREIIKQILKDIYNSGEWEIEIESGTTTNYQRVDKIEKEESTITKTYKYTTTSGQIVEKTDKNAEKDNFVTLLCDNGKAKGSLRSIASWMFESIERNQVLCDKLDLMKYLLGIAFGKNYGVEEFDFNIFDPENFQSISGSDIQGGTIEEKVWYAIRKAGFSEYATAGVMGNISAEGVWNPESVEWGYDESDIGAGVGLCGWTNANRGTEGNRTDLENYARSKGKTWKDEDIQIEFLITQLNDGEGPAKGYAKAVVGGVYGGSKEGWMNATSVEEATKQFCGWYERPAEQYFYSSMPGRIAAATEYYNKYKGRDLSTFTISGGSILQCAESIHSYMEKNKYTYSKDINKLASTFEQSKSYKVTCCATYVSWVLREAGYINETIHGADSLASTLQSKYKFEKVDKNKLQAGDIMVSDGHIQIYAGNGQIYNAGYTEAIQRANPYSSENDKTLYGLRAPN